MSNGAIEARFLGIDESNHGRSPEIFVGAYSTNPNHAIISEIGKQRKPSNLVTSLLDTLDTLTDLRYIVFDKKTLSQFEDYQVKQIALIELIGEAKGLELVIFDGELHTHHLEAVKREDPRAIVEVRAKADIKYPIVNTADKAANILYQLYTRKLPLPKRVLSKQLSPDILYYRKVLK